MWLILLDRSGSMGDPFEGGVEFGGRVRTTQEKIKLDAAKAALREHLAGLGVPTAIALITFDSAASVVYEGTSADAAAIARALDDVTAGGGTDVAAALDAAAERVRGDEGSGRARALLISDGLADADAADAAAERARTDGVVAIDVILIDPTDKGLDVARRVAAGGSVAAVASPEALQQDVRRAAREQQLTSGDPEAVSAVARQDASDVLAGAESGEPVAFTAAYPGSVLAGVWYSLVLYLHLARLQDVVDALVDRRAGELGSTPVSVHAAAFSQIRRGTTLRLTPMVDGLVFNPSSQEVAWIEDMQQSTFRVAAPVDSQAGPRGGVLEVHAGPLLVALVPLAVRIRTPSEPEEPDTRTTQRPLQRVFASYAHVDEDVVRACAEAYKAFGIHVLIDKETLRSGERWEETLHRLIDESDQFQLFWSSSARGSQYVEDEWQHALRLQGAKGEQFIRPLYWELPLPDPPSELGHLHFARLDVAELARASRQPPEPTPEAQRGMRPPPSVPVVVVPLLPFVAQTRVDEVRADAAEAAAFVETISGRRYYPAPTLLVDEHAVRTIRDTLIPVDRPLPDSVPPVIRTELLALLDVLKAIALTFHVRRLHPDLDDDTFAARFGEGTVLPAAEWSELRFRAEGFLSDVASTFRDPDPELAPVLSAPLEPQLSPSLADVETFFQQLSACLAEGLRTCGEFRCEPGYWVDVKSWNTISAIAPAVIETNPVDPSRYFAPREPELTLAGPFSAVTMLFRDCANRVLELLRAASGPRTQLVQAVETIVPTFGIYAPPDGSSDTALHAWAIERGIPPQLTLAGTPRVLFCLSAQDRFTAAVRDASDVGDPDALARGFQRTVLVHEHFHAAVEAGLDEDGASATGPSDAAAWRRALPLNEALAAWTEVHFSRTDVDLSRAVWRYVRSGSYPNWPYAGAERVEELFTEGGLDRVRQLIDRLRAEPDEALAEFNSHV